MSTPFPDEVEARVIEFEPGKFAPVVSYGGEWKFRGGRVYNSREAAETAIADEVSFGKKFWAGQLANRSNAVVVNGTHYRLGSRGDEVRPHLRGSSGSTFHLRDMATGEVITCSDLWYQGIIPDFARSAFPDTHEFVSPSEEAQP